MKRTVALSVPIVLSTVAWSAAPTPRVLKVLTEGDGVKVVVEKTRQKREGEAVTVRRLAIYLTARPETPAWSSPWKGDGQFEDDRDSDHAREPAGTAVLHDEAGANQRLLEVRGSASDARWLWIFSVDADRVTEEVHAQVNYDDFSQLDWDKQVFVFGVTATQLRLRGGAQTIKTKACPPGRAPVVTLSRDPQSKAFKPDGPVECRPAR